MSCHLLCFSCFGCGGPTPAPVPPSIFDGPASSLAPSARAPTAPGGPSEEDAAVPISLGNPFWGSRTALVTIVEFADFECPFCARAEATLSRIREVYGPETIRIVWKNSPLPFHRNGAPAAEAAAGVFAMAGSDAFWKFHDAALCGSAPLGPQSYERWAIAAGVTDISAFRAGIASHAWTEAIGKDLAEGKALGVFGTPTFFVNGLPLAGALPFPTFQGIIDRQIEAAKAKVASGTPRERLYAELAHENRARADQQQQDDDRNEAKTVYKVPLGKSPVRGPPTALVTMIEFADYECPFCIRAEATVKALRDQYGDKLRVVFKDDPLPSHPRAEPAAQAALEVRAEKGDAAFWAMHDALLAGPDDMSDDALASLATRFGAHAPAVKLAMSRHLHRNSIEDDVAIADDFDVEGTPHFFINGRRLIGAQSKESFDAIIEEEIKGAEEIVSKGVKPLAVYDALVQGGLSPHDPEKNPLSPIPPDDPVRGNPSAKVTVHIWSDFECPFCKLAEPALTRLISEYGPKVMLVWHDLPLPMHPHAPLAARAAREALHQKAGPGFWAMHDEIFAHQEQLEREDLDRYARQLGLDMNQWKAALDGDAHQSALDADRLAADAMNITGTPGFVVVASGAHSGYFASGVQKYPMLRKLVERARAEAK